MSHAAQHLFKTHDDFGEIQVREEGLKRFLAFADNDEQSAWSKNEPLIPQHDYIRSMLLVLLWAQPKKIISLGLGAGILNSLLFHRFPESKQQVAELRPAVIDIAYQYFQLPQGRRLNIHAMDALTFLQQQGLKKADILFSDIYDAQGVNEMQLETTFLQSCLHRLKDEGWLVLNCWKHHQKTDIDQRLLQMFKQLYCVDTPSGNWILFASNSRQHHSNKQLKERAKQLNGLLGFSLSSHMNRLKQLS
ncbi:MAG: spermine synthase [Pseudomonadales bacterium]|nr:spermine synthase [Pseudomonadales bacterium]